MNKEESDRLIRIEGWLSVLNNKLDILWKYASEEYWGKPGLRDWTEQNALVTKIREHARAQEKS